MELFKRYLPPGTKRHPLTGTEPCCLQTGHLYTSQEQVIVTGVERKFKIKIRQVFTFGLAC